MRLFLLVLFVAGLGIELAAASDPMTSDQIVKYLQDTYENKRGYQVANVTENADTVLVTFKREYYNHSPGPTFVDTDQFLVDRHSGEVISKSITQ
jgi:hypothetical protein